MKRFFVVSVLILILIPFVGCGFSTADRAAIIREASATASIRAAELAKREALAAGLSEDAATEVAIIAHREAGKLAEAAAEKLTPESDAPSNWGALIAGAIQIGLMALGGGTRS